MARGQLRVLVRVCGLVSMSLASQPALAKEARPTLVPPGWNVGSVHLRGAPHRGSGMRGAHQPATVAGRRGLTINRTFRMPLTVDGLDALQDGPIRYGDIRSFDPDPSVDGGTQLPYGLDGIGGFGSDLGFDAGEHASVYVRGP